MADVTIRRARPDDVEGIAACMRLCYGETYPKREFYDPPVLARMIAERRHEAVVALVGERMVGHMGWRRLPASPVVAEVGTTVVDPEMRGRGLLRDMATALREACGREGVEGFVHFPTTAHTTMQRLAIGDGPETGVLLAYLPAGAMAAVTGRPDCGPLAVTAGYQVLRPSPPERIFVPDPYRSLIAEVAAEIGLERTVLRPPVSRFDGPVTEVSHQHDDPRSLDRYTVRRAGADVAGIAKGATGLVCHVDLPMDDPAIGCAVVALRGEGFVYGAWLPRYAGVDVLRLQRIQSDDPRLYEANLVSDRARGLLDMIRREAAAVSTTT
jgi:hypothetical protein